MLYSLVESNEAKGINPIRIPPVDPGRLEISGKHFQFQARKEH